MGHYHTIPSKQDLSKGIKNLIPKNGKVVNYRGLQEREREREQWSFGSYGSSPKLPISSYNI